MAMAQKRERSVMQFKRLDKFKLPLTGQQIELHQLDYEGGGMSQLRILIRQQTRFTTVDVDPVTAKHWGTALCRWAEGQTPRAGGASGEAPDASLKAEAVRGDE